MSDGKFMVRFGEDTRLAIKRRADELGMSMNTFIIRSVEKELDTSRDVGDVLLLGMLVRDVRTGALGTIMSFGFRRDTGLLTAHMNWVTEESHTPGVPLQFLEPYRNICVE